MKKRFSHMVRSIIVIHLIIFLLPASLHLAAQQTPFHRGVNLTNWFQAPGPRQVQYNKYGKEDFENIKSLGFDVIRLPINLHFMTSGEPDYILDTVFVEFLGEVIGWAEELEIYLILDNHTFSVVDDTDPEVGNILNKVWSQMAGAFRDRSEYLCYEVLNEPHGIADELWNPIQQGVVETIRQIDTTHYIVIGPAGWNSYNNLAAMPVYDDDLLIYTFHFYDPFLFTHQGASWVTPSMEPIENVPFPYDAAQMPEMPAGLAGSWVGNLFGNYSQDGTEQKIRELIDIAVQFRAQRGVPLFCGEFGVYQPNSMELHRVEWYRAVRTYLDSMNIAWTMWDYHGGFGLFEEDGEGLFEHHLNVPLLEALDMHIPEQTDYERKPDSTGYIMYDDFLTKTIREASYSDGILDYFSTDFPNNGDYCIHWTGASRYRAVVFDLAPDRDFSKLESEGYALDLMVRGDQSSISFDVRFIDSKTTEPEDLPWRMGMTIDDLLTDFDNEWQHLHIPLSSFTEKGSWYIDTWYNPRGEFDWAEVDRFEIVPEAQALGSSNLWFDNLMITNLDTAQARIDTSGQNVTSFAIREIEPFSLTVYPNPCTGSFTLNTGQRARVRYELLSLHGEKLLEGDADPPALVHLGDMAGGIYILRVDDRRGKSAVQKIVLLRN
jgi:endoglucanase